jgi:hypothetical protein
VASQQQRTDKTPCSLQKVHFAKTTNASKSVFKRKGKNSKAKQKKNLQRKAKEKTPRDRLLLFLKLKSS